MNYVVTSNFFIFFHFHFRNFTFLLPPLKSVPRRIVSDEWSNECSERTQHRHKRERNICTMCMSARRTLDIVQEDRSVRIIETELYFCVFFSCLTKSAGSCLSVCACVCVWDNISMFGHKNTAYMQFLLPFDIFNGPHFWKSCNHTVSCYYYHFYYHRRLVATERVCRFSRYSFWQYTCINLRWAYNNDRCLHLFTRKRKTAWWASILFIYVQVHTTQHLWWFCGAQTRVLFMWQRTRSAHEYCYTFCVCVDLKKQTARKRRAHERVRAQSLSISTNLG